RPQASIELVFATNVLGHFALVNGLLPTLERTPGARVVTLGSMISRLRDSDLTDLQLDTSYERWRAYAQSKIAAQVFGFELDRRLRSGGWSTRALVVHPGYSISGRTPRVPGVNEPTVGTRIADNLQLLWAQGKHKGAWSTVRAVTDPSLTGGQFIGPRLLTRGRPDLQKPTRTST
ncbi:short chain dehydrogenase, partial [Rhizobium johnstonii]